MNPQVFHGTFITSDSPEKLNILTDSWLIAKDGIIEDVCPELPEQYKPLPIHEIGNGVMIPAFSDLHIHASQFTERGIGMDALLFDWLNDLTFPQESRFADIEYAAKVYPQVIRELLRHGTMHGVFFTTIHYDACSLFFDMLKKSGMYAFTGKVNMDQNSPDFLSETTEESIASTERFVTEHLGDDHVKPILTPRFAPTCSRPLLMGLGRIAKTCHVGLQTHLVESKAEAAWARELNPDCASDGEIYEKCDLLGHGPAVLAHVIFPEEVDKAILRKYNCMTVHCPDATTNVTAGIMPASSLLKEGVQISLGSDIGGGHGAGIYQQTSRAVQLSKLKEFYEEGYKRLDFAAAFHMATAAGGSIFGNVGRLEPGYRMNTLIIDGVEDDGFPLTPAEKIERFCYIGDDRNISARYLDGRLIDPDKILL